VTIWVDADACPAPVRAILFKAARRTGVVVVLVANQPQHPPADHNIRSLQVTPAYDAADNEILTHLAAGDLLITSDIPLAAEAIEREAHVITPRGERYTRETIGDRLTMRDFMETLRATGAHAGGPLPFGAADRQRFANQLDRLLTHRR